MKAIHCFTFIVMLSTLSLNAVRATITYESGYGGSILYTHSSSDSITSYDWDTSGALNYMTSAGYPDVNIWRNNGVTTTNIYSNPSHFSGASVVAIGDYIYFNDSDYTNQNIHRYDPNSASPSSSPISTTANYGLYNGNGDLFITGAIGFGTNHIYYSSLDGNGDLNNDPALDLGETFGSSGPLVFDASGNMYYAPGYGDLSIYKWSASQVSDAIADPINNPLSQTGVRWADYSGEYTTMSGATGMAFDANGNLIVSLTSFSAPSALVSFNLNGAGAYAGNDLIMTTTNRLGDIREHDGEIYFAVDNQIIQVIPEIGTLSALCIGFALLALSFLKRKGA
ncbi:hypothetical protein P0Y35_18850 [Kiritimatiellaeota bacterium B1221]|nr:hypothetical protein [Kiritimatiellaeota bacterium B1221]